MLNKIFETIPHISSITFIKDIYFQLSLFFLKMQQWVETTWLIIHKLSMIKKFFFWVFLFASIIYLSTSSMSLKNYTVLNFIFKMNKNVLSNLLIWIFNWRFWLDISIWNIFFSYNLIIFYKTFSDEIVNGSVDLLNRNQNNNCIFQTFTLYIERTRKKPKD
jgi:hypothetical protein